MLRRRVKRHAVTQPSDESYRLIPLTQGQNAIVDAADFTWLTQWDWCACWRESSSGFYAISNRCPYGLLMHRAIIQPEKPFEVDHINRNTLDNRRENLRKVTRAQNNYNQRLRKDNASGFRGVYYRADRGTWDAMIKINKKCIYLGAFNTSKEAAYAYDEAARNFHGEFAFQNFP